MAKKQGLGIATKSQKLISEQQSTEQVPAPAIQAVPDASSPQQAQVDPGLQPSDIIRPSDPGDQTSVITEPPPEAEGQIAPAAAPQRKSLIPNIREDPLAAFGLILRNISAGYRGAELPTDVLARQDRQAEMTDIALRMEKSNYFMKIMDKGLELGRSVNDPEKRASAVKAYADNFPMFDGIGDNINKILDSNESKTQYGVLRENMSAIHLLAKGDDDLFNQIIGNKALYNSMLESNARNKRGFLTNKIPEIIQFANANGLRMQSVDDIFAINDRLDEPLDALALDALTRQSGIAARFGLKTQAQALEAGDDTGGGRKVTLTPEQVAKENFPPGTIVQVDENNTMSVVFSPPKGDKRDRMIADVEAQGKTHNEAVNKVDKHITLELVPSTGRVRLIDRINNTATEVPVELLTNAEGEFEIPDQDTLLDLAEDATGVMSSLSEVISDTVGQTGLIDVNEKVLKARQTFKASASNMIRVLTPNKKYPVHEIKRIQEAVDIQPSVFKSEDALIVRLKSLNDFLIKEERNAQTNADDPRMPDKARGEWQEGARAIKDFRLDIGVDKYNARQAQKPLSAQEEARFDKILRDLRKQ